MVSKQLKLIDVRFSSYKYFLSVVVIHYSSTSELNRLCATEY